jgi:hypothetical protein
MAERAGAVRTVELPASHAVMMSRPAEIVDVIVTAAEQRRDVRARSVSAGPR